MSAYLLGLCTLPALVLGGYLGLWLLGHAVSLLGRLSLGTLWRVRPDDERHLAHKRASVMFGLERGLVFSLGEFALVIGLGIDEERRAWAYDRLLRPLKKPEYQPVFPPRRKIDGDDS